MNRRLPKRGFHNPFRKQMAVLNVGDLVKLAQGRSELDLQEWIEKGRIKKAGDGVKVLGRGEVSVPLSVRAHFFSGSARRKILDAGGRIEEIA